MVMVVESRAAKRVKRRVSLDVYDAVTFPWEEEVSWVPFRRRVQRFVEGHARSTFPCLVTWQILLRVDDLICDVALDVVEEDVTRSTRSVYCDQCRVVGWSAHPVCKKRYHFIIRANSSPLDGFQKPCSSCGNLLPLSDSRCKLCNAFTTADDIEDWVYSQFDDNTHLLHGVVHSNGHGHLLTVNGREGGSTVLSGFDIMNFWDRLCQTLAVRKVTVMDVSKKYGMEYRLLHAISEGHSWYGNWGYEFGSGSYAVTMDAYRKAIESLASMPLALFLITGRKPCTRLQTVIAFYQSISELELLTVKDLFLFLLRFINVNRKSSKSSTSVNSGPSSCTVLCAWSRSDVDQVQQALIKVLTAAVDGRWVSRRTLKGALCKVASPQLLDYAIKHIAGTMTANGKVVRARFNPYSSIIEYRLELFGFQHCSMQLDSSCPLEEHVRNDIRFLYDSLLNPQTMVNFKPEHVRDHMIDAATKLIDCKQFMKDFKLETMGEKNPFGLTYWCQVELLEDPIEPGPPTELIVLPLNATVADLKEEVSKTYQEVYAMFKKFRVVEIPEYSKIEDSMTLKILIGLNGLVRIQGKCPAKYGLSRFRMERGTESWSVDCVCGTKDDDGERMLECDKCSVWQHTRCIGIECSDSLPAKFICIRCAGSSDESQGPTSREEGSGRVAAATCRGDAIVSAGSAERTNLTVSFGIR